MGKWYDAIEAKKEAVRMAQEFRAAKRKAFRKNLLFWGIFLICMTALGLSILADDMKQPEPPVLEGKKLYEYIEKVIIENPVLYDIAGKGN